MILWSAKGGQAGTDVAAQETPAMTKVYDGFVLAYFLPRAIDHATTSHGVEV
jgi:hypothetical protein